MKSHSWLFYKHAKQGFAVLSAAKKPGMADKFACRLTDALEANLDGLLRGYLPVRVDVFPGEESQCIMVSWRRVEYRA